jgi:CheY-like chemotaxis protein
MSFLPASKILVAEDNAMNQLIITKLFESIGITIDLAENGEQALAMAKCTQYDLIFMDIQMPEMDGIEATEKIIEHYGENIVAPVIIAMTANALKEDEEMCLSAGMSDFISKPVFLDTLKHTLIKWTEQAQLVNFSKN